MPIKFILEIHGSLYFQNLVKILYLFSCLGLLSHEEACLILNFLDFLISQIEFLVNVYHKFQSSSAFSSYFSAVVMI